MESENFVAIYNIAPMLRGHSLVVPRKHYSSLIGLPDAELAEFTKFSRRVTELLLEAFKGEGFDWSIQEGSAAGQSIDHLHLHIVIRKPGDLKEGKEWYELIKGNENQILDSTSRKRLSPEEYHFYTDYLRNEVQLFELKRSNKE